MFNMPSSKHTSFNILKVQLPSWVRSSKIDRMSAFKCTDSTVAANFPKLEAADLLTMGMSS
jgi:hypothetical protein